MDENVGNLSNIQKFIMEDNFLTYEPPDEAYDLLQNGILVETSKGLVCMSLTDALSSDLNLSEEELKNVAAKLILEQNVPNTSASKAKERVFLKTSNVSMESDGFSSECSDISSTPSSSTLIAFIPSTSEIKPPLDGPRIIPTIINPIKTISEPNTGSSSVSDSDTSVSVKKEPTSEAGNLQIPPATIIEVHKPPKRRGGWPKGRKRKPELLNLPPKAPATGYNLYLNEQRKLFKDSSLVFHEITKIIGNRWSNLTLDDKRPYLEKAEEDKRRYREELKQYRQSDAYRAYLNKKRKNRLQNNVLSESDMDATDEIDEEDNEELYCRTCDQWFHNLHNKHEHLKGWQHMQSIAGAIKRELSGGDCLSSASLDESSLDALPTTSRINPANSCSVGDTVNDCIVNLVSTVAKREEEIKALKRRFQETALTQNALCQQLSALRYRQNKLKNDLVNLKEGERIMEGKVSNLWQVPSWFIITDFNTNESTDF